MSTRSDAIAAPPPQVPVRPAYALGVLLDADDLFAEQDYARGRWARALKYLFGTGTIAGLRVSFRPETQELAVSPGLALDPLGRLIELARPASIALRGGPGPSDSWFDMQLDADLEAGWISGAPRQLVADVFVRLVVCDHHKTAAFETGPFDALDAAPPARLRDGYELGLVIRPEAALDRDAPQIPVPDDRRILARQPTDTRENALHWQRRRILEAWRDANLDWTVAPGGVPRPLPLEEHLVLPRDSQVEFPFFKQLPSGERVQIRHDPSEVGRDPTSVLLARVHIPVSDAAPPVDLGTAVAIDNDVRRFVRHTGIYTQPSPGGGA